MRGQPLRTLFVFLLSLATAAPAAAQEGDPDVAIPPMPSAPERALTLAQALEVADREAVDLEVLRLQVQRSETAERVAWAGVLPVITGVLTYQRFDEPIQRAGVGIVRDENQISGQISISETLSLRTVSAVRIAEANSDLSRTTLEDARRLAHGAIARLFFTVLAARHAAELTRTQIADAVRQWEAARARAELGAAIRLDADRAEVAALDAVVRTADADAALERAWDQLGEALGLGEPIDAVPSSLAPVARDEARAVERASASRSDVRAAQDAREVAGRAIDDAWYRFAPTLTLSWTGTVTAPTTLFNPDPAQWIGQATLVFPFYDGGIRYAALRDAQLALDQADAELESAQRRVRIEVRDGLRRVAIAERRLRIAERQAEVARRAAAAAEETFRLGNLSGLELDAARRAAEQADLQRVLAELELSTARVDLLTSTGDL